MRTTFEAIAWRSDGAPYIWVMRVHAGHAAVWGDPYVGSATVVADGARAAILVFTCLGYNRDVREAIAAGMVELGVSVVPYDRIKYGIKLSFDVVGRFIRLKYSSIGSS